MAIVEREEWPKLQVAKINGWTIGVSGSQHVLGWLIISPPDPVEGSLTDLSDEQLLEFKKVAKVSEELLNTLFSPDLFNYNQTGNVVRNFHIHLLPRYSSPREFGGHRFSDDSFGHQVRYLRYEYLAPKEVVFDLVKSLREALKKMDLKDVEIEISED